MKGNLHWNPDTGQVVIEVKAFGLNHAETYMRKGSWGDVAKVTGIECVGCQKAEVHRLRGSNQANGKIVAEVASS
jgi:NADPH2:quinone reductase